MYTASHKTHQPPHLNKELKNNPIKKNCATSTKDLNSRFYLTECLVK